MLNACLKAALLARISQNKVKVYTIRPLKVATDMYVHLLCMCNSLSPYHIDTHVTYTQTSRRHHNIQTPTISCMKVTDNQASLEEVALIAQHTAVAMVTVCTINYIGGQFGESPTTCSMHACMHAVFSPKTLSLALSNFKVALSSLLHTICLTSYMMSH